MKKVLLCILSVILLLLQFRLWQGDGSIIDITRLNRAIKVEQDNNEKLAQRNHRLDAEVEALKLYPEALEERARAELGMIKQGETFCLVIEPAR